MADLLRYRRRGRQPQQAWDTGRLGRREKKKDLHCCVAERSPCLPSGPDPLYDRERLLILGDLLPEVPGNSSRVVTPGLEDVAGHVH